jgi:nucleoside-diphosphate-sugar epimerase
MLLGRFPTFPRGGLHAVDVRDVATLIAATLQRTDGPQRYIVPGHFITGRELYRAVSDTAGRRLPHLTLPGSIIGPTVALIEAVQRRLPQRWHYPADREGIEIWRRATRFDDSAARTDFGIDPIPLPQTIADTVRWLVESGRVPARRAPRLKTA